MPNTTTIAITSFTDEAGVSSFINDSGLELQQVVDDQKVKRGYVNCIEMWALTIECLSSDELYKIVDIFKNTNFDSPETVCMIIDCDDNEFLCGCYPRCAKEIENLVRQNAMNEKALESDDPAVVSHQ